MAKQWARYRLDPEKYNYRAGQTVDIMWNVAETGCGSAPVSIKNTATASLYNYTPYQPNAAALAAYPGVGDRCSAYGNRNFFYLFRKYFGSTGGGASTTTSSAVLSTGKTVTIPKSPYVSAALAGQTITAPNAAVAAGLAAGLQCAGPAVRLGWRRVRRRTEQRLLPGRRRLQQLRHRGRVRLLRPDGVRAGHGGLPHAGRFRLATWFRYVDQLGAGAARRHRRLPRPCGDLPRHVRRPALHPRSVLGRHPDPHRSADPDRLRRPGSPVLDRPRRERAEGRRLQLDRDGRLGSAAGVLQRHRVGRRIVEQRHHR